MAKDALKKTSKAHTIYKTQDGKRVPGTTTITGLMNKPFLVTWANRLGLEGIDSNKYRDDAASIGTLAHEMVQAHLQGYDLDTSIYSQRDIDLAENALIKFYEWERNNKIEPIICEVPLVSEVYRYGGTVDCYCLLNGEPTILDFKTGKAIYDDFFFQLAAYEYLLKEHGHEVKQRRILRIGRDETEGFEERGVPDTSKYFEVFKHLLSVYYLKKELKIS